MRHEAAEFLPTSDGWVGTVNYETKLPLYEQTNADIDIFALNKKISVGEDSERIYAQSLLSHEVLRQSELDTVFKKFNSQILEGEGEINYIRGFPAVGNTPFEETLTGRSAHTATFNGIVLQWESISFENFSQVYYQAGIGIKDGDEIAPFFFTTTDGYATSATLWTELMLRKRPFAFLSRPRFPSEAPVYPIIQNGAITTSLYFADLRNLAHNDIAKTWNSKITENTAKEMLPLGVKEPTSLIKLLPPISHKAVFTA